MSQIKYKGTTYQIFDTLSNKDMTGWDLSLRNDLNGKIIYNSCLSNETPDAVVLPANLSGAKFVACNLDNVLIPPGNEVVDCLTRRFQVQNDGEDWFLEEVP